MISFVLVGVTIVIVFGIISIKEIKIFTSDISLDYLSKKNSESIKAICAISVMLHHITNEIYCGPVLFTFQMIGYLMVAVFFFYSGYGLIYSLENKENYMKHFFKSRISRLVIPYAVSLIIYTTVKSIFDGFNILTVINSYINGEPIVSNSWFIITLLILYLLFWFSFGIIKNKRASWIVFTALFAVLCLNFKFAYWSPTIICFLVGMIWSSKKETIDEQLLKYNIQYIFILLICFSVFFILRSKFNSFIFDVLCRVLCSVFFSSLIICLQTRFSIGNRMLKFISKISLEIYLYHGLFIFLLKRLPIVSEHWFLFLPSVLVSTIVFAFGIRLVLDRLPANMKN